MKTLLLFSMLLPCCSLLFAEEVSISTNGETLKGVMDVSGQDKSRAVFIISGSGPTDRDGNSVGAPGKNNSLKYLAEDFNKAGITTLRVDKRGIGASADAAVKESDLRFSTYVEDVVQWIKFLEKQGYTEVILVGHSEGALVATLAASSRAAKGLVCIAGAGRSAPAILREQLKPKLPKELYAQADKTITSLTECKTVKDFPPALNALFRPSIQPYLISWFEIDPVNEISEIKVPVLIVQGSTDIQVSTKDAQLLHAGAKGSTLMVVEGMNHVLKAVKGDLAAQMPSYFDPDLPLHKDLAPGIIEFLKTAEKANEKANNSTEPDSKLKQSDNK